MTQNLLDQPPKDVEDATDTLEETTDADQEARIAALVANGGVAAAALTKSQAHHAETARADQEMQQAGLQGLAQREQGASFEASIKDMGLDDTTKGSAVYNDLQAQRRQLELRNQLLSQQPSERYAALLDVQEIPLTTAQDIVCALFLDLRPYTRSYTLGYKNSIKVTFSTRAAGDQRKIDAEVEMANSGYAMQQTFDNHRAMTHLCFSMLDFKSHDKAHTQDRSVSNWWEVTQKFLGTLPLEVVTEMSNKLREFDRLVSYATSEGYDDAF